MSPLQVFVFAMLFTPLLSMVFVLLYYDVIDTMHDVVMELMSYFHRIGYLIWVAILLLFVIGCGQVCV